VWAFGLYVLVYTTQYVYMWIGSAVTGASFGELAAGHTKSYETVFLRGLVGLVLGVPATILAVRFLWRRSLDWMQLRFRGRYFAGGTAFGIVVALAIVAGLGAFGFARITGYPSRFTAVQLAAVLVGLCGWAVFKALLEEVVFRGMVVREFALRWGWPVAALAGGLYFAAAHLIAIVPILTPLLTAKILIAGTAASALFTALYVRGGSLWLPIGFHAGWNLALSAIAGTTMSGRSSGFGVFQTELSGPDVVTGGEFGVEASVVAVAVMVVTTACVVLVPRRGDDARVGNDRGVGRRRSGAALPGGP
jgi:membrane protease YdiL (CAAX protease family)